MKTFLQRDGVSQFARRLTALDPEYAPIDERTFKDLLAFARELAKELNYFGVENGQISVQSDWSAFLNEDADLDEIVAYMQNPEKFSAEQAAPWSRPHFALFLSFLHLLRHAQDQLNGLTKKHLDFYYRQVLGMTKKQALPDQVNVLIDLAPNVEQFELLEGTLLNAGVDSSGRDLLYKTDRTFVANQAQVAKLSSIFAEKEVTGIREARELYDGPKEEAFVEMLKIALGAPLPGELLPSYREDDEKPVDYAQLLLLNDLANFVPEDLYLSFPDFREMMRLKKQRDEAHDEWTAINQFLEKAGQTREPEFVLEPADPRDFDANLLKALGNPSEEEFSSLFDGIPEIKTIYDAYNLRNRSDIRPALKERIQERLFLGIDDFTEMMHFKVRIDNEWSEVNRILTEAARTQRKNPQFSLKITEPSAFDDNLKKAVGADIFTKLEARSKTKTLRDYCDEVAYLEGYFFMPVEHFVFIMSVVGREQPLSQEWDHVYKILAEAHKQKVFSNRREMLRQKNRDEGFENMLAFAVGDDGRQAELPPLQLLLEHIKNAANARFLEDIEAKVKKIADGETEIEISDDEWEKTYRIVELAQRSLENLEEPTAQKEEWRNLYAFADATAAAVSLEIENDDQNARWKTFGHGQPVVAAETPPPPEFGFGLCSPILTLNEGKRTITLTLGFESEQFDAEKIEALWQDETPGPFRIEISTAEGWAAASQVEFAIGDYSALSSTDELEEPLQALQFKLTFPEDVPPLTPPDDQAQIASDHPVLRIMLRQIWQPHGDSGVSGRYITQYRAFKDLVLKRARIKVEASGILPSQAQNDESSLDASKPFEPFGVSPAVGSRLLLGHPELAAKKLDALNFTLEWMNAPESFVDHYVNYSAVPEGTQFTSRISLIEKRLDREIREKEPLFAAKNPNELHTISLQDIAAKTKSHRAAEPSIEAGDLLQWSRYLQFELNTPDFQHDAYPAIVAQKSVEFAAKIANKETVDPKDYQVAPPYTPKLKKLTFSYTSSLEIVMEDRQPGEGLDRMYHIHPFGYCELRPEDETGKSHFMPQFNFEGELYIGVRNVQAPQNLSLLVQMAEGSADPDIEPEPVQWSRLDGDHWVSMENGVLEDATRGLINSGVILFDLKPAQPSTLFPNDLYWLRAAIPRKSSSVCDAVAIHAQAVSATFVDHDNAPDHLDSPLPAESISDLADPLPEIGGVRQPYTSFGGKPAESDAFFYTRISERLRHKRRALSIWDYEHMILDQFPEIYKAKCLPASPERPGNVEVIVIPEIRNKLPFNPFEPKAPTNMLADIETYLSKNVPGFVSVNVKNARYIPVKIRVGVRFLPRKNEGFYKQRLNDSLNRFLSPWAYDEGADVVIGGRVYANVIINFIEEQSYVDYVAQIKLFHSEDGGATFKLALPQEDSSGYWLETARPDEVLAAARSHEIDIISESGYEDENFTGVNHMKIELDFIVGEDREQTVVAA